MGKWQKVSTDPIWGKTLPDWSDSQGEYTPPAPPVNAPMLWDNAAAMKWDNAADMEWEGS